MVVTVVGAVVVVISRSGGGDVVVVMVKEVVSGDVETCVMWGGNGNFFPLVVPAFSSSLLHFSAYSLSSYFIIG